MNTLFSALCILFCLAFATGTQAQGNWEDLNKQSMTAFNAKDYEGAFALTQQALAQAGKEYGTESPRYALSSHNLGYIYSLRKDYAEAEKNYLRALEIRKKLNLEADYALTLGIYGTMLSRNMNRPADAEKYLLLAKDLDKKLYTEKSSQYYGIASELATLYFNAGKYKDAEPYYLYMAASHKERSGPKSENYALAMKDLMTLYTKAGDKNKYMPVYEELLDIMAAMGLDGEQSYLEGTFTVASYYEEQNNIPKAIKNYKALLPAIKKKMGDTSTLYLMPLIKLTGFYSQQADYRNMSVVAVEMVDLLRNKPGERSAYLTGLEGAAAVFKVTGDYSREEEALLALSAAFKQDKGSKSTEYLLAMRKLGDAQLSLGKHKEAIQSYRDALSNRQQKDIEYAADLTKLGYVQAITGKLRDAEKNYDEAMKLFRAAGKEQTNDYAVLLNYMGSLYSGTGRQDEGEAMLLKAKAIYAATVGVKHPNYAVALANIASVYINKGDYNAAEQALLEHLQIKADNFGKEHPEYAFALLRLALFYKNIGNQVKWESNLVEALKIQEKTLPPDHPSLMTTLNNLAVFYNNTSQYAKAEPFYTRSLEIARKNLGERADYLNTLTNFAGLYVNLKNFAKAEELYLKAQTLAKKLYGSGIEYANALQGMALMYDYAGNYAKAEPYFLQAFEIKKKLLPEGNPGYLQIHLNLARLYQAMHNYVKAEPYFAKVKELMLNGIDRNFAFLSESEKQDYLNTLNYRFEQMQNFYLAYQKTKKAMANEAFNTELATKGLTLNSSIEMRKAIAQSEQPDALKQYDEWMKIRSEIARLTTSGTATAEEIATLETNASAIEKELTRLSGRFNQGRVLSRARMEEVKQKLGDNDVAIEFAAFRQFDDVSWTDSTIYVAIVLRKGDANAQMIRLCEGRQLDELIKKKGQDDSGFITSLYSTRGIETENDNNSLANGKKLYELIWKPLDNLLKPGNRVYFAPAGILNQIAFAAIPHGGGKLLSDQYKLSQVSSTAMLLKDAGTIPVHSITLFGGIKYDLSDTERKPTGKGATGVSLAADGNRGGTWNYLPGTLTEAEAIAKMAGDAKYITTTYFGADGLEEHIKGMSDKKAPGIVHIASHGFFFPDPELNYKEADASGNVFSISANAMNRSGMLFAGANSTWKGNPPATGEDGILTAFEASNLSLANTSLVVLSACETGLGDIKGNEGVYGLQRSFKMAGVTYLMMSLWKVPDAETAEFMRLFYAGLFGGKEIETSFTAAQDAMKLKYPKAPYKWAAFVLVK